MHLCISTPLLFVRFLIAVISWLASTSVTEIEAFLVALCLPVFYNARQTPCIIYPYRVTHMCEARTSAGT